MDNEPGEEPEPEPEEVTEIEETTIEDVLTEEQLDELEEEEIELLEELLDNPEIDIEIIEDIEEILDDEPVTEEEIIELVDNDNFDELPPEAKEQIVQAVNEAPEAVKETFEQEIDVFSSSDYGDYVMVGSRIDVDDRKTIITVTAAATAISSSIRPTATASTAGGPTSGPTRRRGR